MFDYGIEYSFLSFCYDTPIYRTYTKQSTCIKRSPSYRDRLMTFHQLNNFLSFYPDCLDTLSINYFDAISKKNKAVYNMIFICFSVYSDLESFFKEFWFELSRHSKRYTYREEPCVKNN